MSARAEDRPDQQAIDIGYPGGATTSVIVGSGAPAGDGLGIAVSGEDVVMGYKAWLVTAKA